MCSVCKTNHNYTQAILERLKEAREARAKEQARKDAYNASCGHMDYDFDCCDSSYAELEETIWDALKWLGIVPKE